MPLQLPVTGVEKLLCVLLTNAPEQGIESSQNSDELWSINAANLAVAPTNTTVDQLLAQTCSR